LESIPTSFGLSENPNPGREGQIISIGISEFF